MFENKNLRSPGGEAVRKSSGISYVLLGLSRVYAEYLKHFLKLYNLSISRNPGELWPAKIMYTANVAGHVLSL